MSLYVILEDGRRSPDAGLDGLSVRHLCQRSPSTISERLAELDHEGSDRASLANLYFAKSWRARELTILWWMCERRSAELVSIICAYTQPILEHLLGRALPPNVVVVTRGRETPDVTLGQVGTVILKALLHRSYRLIGYRGGRLKRRSAIRAYGEISSRLYSVEQESACLLIYPVAYGWEAHRRYVRQMLRIHPAAIRPVFRTVSGRLRALFSRSLTNEADAGASRGHRGDRTCDQS